jgi:hypothetical protein
VPAAAAAEMLETKVLKSPPQRTAKEGGEREGEAEGKDTEHMRESLRERLYNSSMDSTPRKNHSSSNDI